MKPRTHKEKSRLIVYDADRVPHPDASLFDAAYWQAQGGLAGEAVGRGSALYLETPFGRAVLREYLRGGLPGKFIRNTYLFTGWKRSRPVQEFDILVQLFTAGLPVPEPIAAQTCRRGLFYTGSLLTRRIEGALPLADVMVKQCEDRALWRRTGACIRRFHDHGLVLADLNARNILADSAGDVFLIDFDRARMAGHQPASFAGNLKRLRRSLDKLWPVDAQPYLEPCWEWLNEAYERGDAGE